MFDLTPYLQLGRYRLDLSRANIMGVINRTPDSFSAQNSANTAEQALRIAQTMHANGADVIDVGGESTRPGATPISLQEELDRVIPVIEAINANLPVPISVDTSKAEVMRAAVAAGAVIINDVYALRKEGAMAAAQATGAAVVLMHMQADPATMQDAPQYADVVEDVARFLTERIFSCQLAGIEKHKLIVDPGFGFGKSTQHNLELLGHLDRFKQLECPLLVGLSRKRSIGEITGRAQVEDRAAGSLAAHLIAVQRGAKIIRTHDVAMTCDALKVLAAVPTPRPKPNHGTSVQALFE